jgi:hypothetical protein
VGCLVFALIAVGCRSTQKTSLGDGSSPSPDRHGQISPGHDSPEAAVVGLISGLKQSNAQVPCSFVIPPEQSLCLSRLPRVKVKGFQLGHTAVSGNRALVTLIVDKLCAESECFTNHDPDAGLPNGTTTFQHAFHQTLRSASDPATACVRMNGRWYVIV